MRLHEIMFNLYKGTKTSSNTKSLIKLTNFVSLHIKLTCGIRETENMLKVGSVNLELLRAKSKEYTPVCLATGRQEDPIDAET